MGYTIQQLKELFGDEVPRFNEWFRGQTGAICEGRTYNHETKDYEVACGGIAHGLVIYSWDVDRYMMGLPVID